MPGIFLLSSERSGTNLLRQRLCNSNDSVCSIPPVHILRTLGYWESQFGDLSKPSNWDNVIKYALRCCYERAIPWKHEFTTNEVKERYWQKYQDKRSLIRLTDVLYSMYAGAEGKSWYFCKDLWLFDFADRIANEIEGSRFIQLVRDPRDYVISQLRRPYSHCSVLKHAECWHRETVRSANALKSLSILNKSYFLTYEAFVKNEELYLKSINEWIGISESNKNCISTEMYDFHEWKNIHLPTMKDNYNKYKNDLASYQVKAIESVCWVAMKNAGYTTESISRPRVNIAIRVLDSIRYHLATPIKKVVSNYKLRNESINRRATTKLVEELEGKYR